MSEIDIVCVATTANRDLAHDWRDALEAEGIACEVGEQISFWFDNIPGAQADIWVYRADAHRAREVLELHVRPQSVMKAQVQVA